MAISLYEASVPNYLQIVDAVSGVLEKALTHFREHGVDPQAIVETRLAPDMRPFGFQIQSVVFHSVGALAAIDNGVLTMPGKRPAQDYATLQALIADAGRELRALTPEAIDRRTGAEVVFQVGERRRVFTAEGFLMSFSLPNFYFHAATAYDILRHKGVPLGKLDFMGALRLKT